MTESEKKFFLKIIAFCIFLGFLGIVANCFLVVIFSIGMFLGYFIGLVLIGLPYDEEDNDDN